MGAPECGLFEFDSCALCGYPGNIIPDAEKRELPMSLLRSGFVPAEGAEKEAISQRIRKAELDIVTVDEEIARMQLAMECLKSRRENIQLYMNCQHALLSPIRHLPNELLSEIFLHCYANINVCTSKPSMLDVERVCRRWRDICSSTPRLWVDLFICPDDEVDVEDKFVIRRLAACLNQSQQLPLSVHIETIYPNIFPLPVVDELVKHSSRWRDASFAVDVIAKAERQSMLTGTKRSVQPDLLVLRHLHLSGPHKFLRTALKMFQNAPMLHGLLLSYFTSPEMFLKLPWSQITELCLHSCTLDDDTGLFGLLRRMPNLKILSLTMCAGIEDIDFTQEGEEGQPVLLPRLDSLAFQPASDVDDFRAILDGLVAPGLKHLWLGTGRPGDFLFESSVARSFTSFIIRSKCIVESLSLHGFPDEYTLPILQSVPRARDVACNEDNIIQFLIWNDDESDDSKEHRLLPDMRNLFLHFPVLDEEILREIVEVIRSRTKLETLQRVLVGTASESVAHTLNELGAALGIDITINTINSSSDS